jgi:hypothetical protein
VVALPGQVSAMAAPRAQINRMKIQARASVGGHELWYPLSRNRARDFGRTQSSGGI